MQSKDFPVITPERKLAAIGHMLQRRHDGRFLVYNLSEVDYETTVLDDQVLTFSFPGSPSPPLGQVFFSFVFVPHVCFADISVSST